MVIMYDNFDLMKEPPTHTPLKNMDIATINYIPHDYNFIIPMGIKEIVKFTIFEGGKAIRSGDVIGNTFTATGKTQLATLVGTLSSGAAINAIICTVGGSDYSQSVTNTTPGNVSTLRVTSGTFTTAGTYTVVAGAAGAVKYNTITTNIIVGAGQSVQYVIDYVFTGPSPTFANMCAARLGSVTTGNYNYHIGTVKVTATDATVITSTLTASIATNTLTLNSAGMTSTGKTFNTWAWVFATLGTEIYVGSAMTIPLASSQTLNVRGVFVFG